MSLRPAWSTELVPGLLRETLSQNNSNKSKNKERKKEISSVQSEVLHIYNSSTEKAEAGLSKLVSSLGYLVRLSKSNNDMVK